MLVRLLVVLIALCGLRTVHGPSANGQVRADTTHGAITGLVLDAVSGESVVDAHVFLAGTTRGTTTSPAGTFRLDQVPAGAYRIVITRIGYASTYQDTLLLPGATVDITVPLIAEVVSLGEVTVSADQDRRWPKRYRTFEYLFLGESDNSRWCTVQNAESLSFDTSWWGRFEAVADAPLIIDNRALGYQVTYYLKTFERTGTLLRYDGDPLFKPLTPVDTTQAQTWAENRERAYRGSLRHFLWALYHGKLSEEGFTLYLHPSSSDVVTSRHRYRVSGRRILRSTQPDDPEGTRRISFMGRLEVVYTEEPESRAYVAWQHGPRAPRTVQTSYLTLNDGPTLIDHHGETLDPFGLTAYGYFAFERIADLVPIEYASTR